MNHSKELICDPPFFGDKLASMPEHNIICMAGTEGDFSRQEDFGWSEFFISHGSHWFHWILLFHKVWKLYHLCALSTHSMFYIIFWSLGIMWIILMIYIFSEGLNNLIWQFLQKRYSTPTIACSTGKGVFNTVPWWCACHCFWWLNWVFTLLVTLHFSCQYRSSAYLEASKP